MELFYRRPLCLFCLCFMIGSVGAWLLSDAWLLRGMWIVGAVAILFLGLTLLIRRWRFNLLTVVLCALMVLLSFLHSFLTISLPKQQAAEYLGDRTVLCYVVAKESASYYTTEYLVRIEQIDGDKVDIRAQLILDESVELSPGDRIYTLALLEAIEVGAYEEKEGKLLTVYVTHPESALVQRMPEDSYFLTVLTSKSGVRILSDRIRQWLGDRLEGLLRTEKGTLASGFFMGDQSEIPPQIKRDFRRSGTSHQMAVSGLHIAVLLGSIDWILRKFYIHKTVRCGVVTLFSFLFLVVTGFSMSACRSVFMLYAVYLSYLFFEENDAQTSLFVSITLLLLLSPYAVVDLGLWMSFFATLGLLIFYPLCEEKIPVPKQKNPFLRFLLRLLRSCLLIGLMTIIANLFLLPIMWLFFGEFSWVAVGCNILLSPIAEVFLIGIPILLLFSGVPWLGDLLCLCVEGIGEAIIRTVRVFSNIPNATVSLNYDFAGIIVVILTIVMIVFLVIRLQRKWLIAMPPIAAVVAFSVCLALFHGLYGSPRVTKSMEEEGMLYTVTEGSSIAFCDQSNGSWKTYHEIKEELSDSTATEIQAIVLTNMRAKHRSVLDLLMHQAVVRTLYLPTPSEDEDATLAKALWDIAEECGTDVVFYQWEEVLPLTDLVAVKPIASDTNTILLSFLSSEELTVNEAHAAESDSKNTVRS